MNGGETDVTPKISALNITYIYTYIYIYIYLCPIDLKVWL